jgi:hypothetical protein
MIDIILIVVHKMIDIGYPFLLQQRINISKMRDARNTVGASIHLFDTAQTQFDGCAGRPADLQITSGIQHIINDSLSNNRQKFCDMTIRNDLQQRVDNCTQLDDTYHT